MASRASEPAIVGVYETRQARSLQEEPIALFVEAIQGALADARLSKRDLDGVSGPWPGPGGSNVAAGSADWAKQLGVELTWVNETHPAGPTGLQTAYAAIKAGYCNTVVLVDGQARLAERAQEPGNEFIDIWGTIPPSLYALVAQRHMHLFGTTENQLATAAAAIRNNGHLNPDAIFYDKGPFTPEHVLASRIISTPFHLLDVAMMSEGAAAIVLSNRIQEPRRAVYLRGAATSYIGNAYADAPLYEEVGLLGRSAAERAFGVAGVARDDIDVFELFDANSFEVIRQFEAFGYCPQGEGGRFVADHDLTVHGDMPTCTDGGLLSHSHIGSGQRTLKVKAAVDQLRGECGVRQVADARAALVTAGGSAARYLSVAILSSEPK